MSKEIVISETKRLPFPSGLGKTGAKRGPITSKFASLKVGECFQVTNNSHKSTSKVAILARSKVNSFARRHGWGYASLKTGRVVTFWRTK